MNATDCPFTDLTALAARISELSTEVVDQHDPCFVDPTIVDLVRLRLQLTRALARVDGLLEVYAT